ncbi:MAG: undecaprenyl-diphosphate phosphatase [bacterium]|nr:undecaprenyl-diphosphate phosphatase [bacterium]
MSLLDAILVGVVQGLAEFLPISSSGHLVVTRYFYGVHDLSLSYIVLLHAGTLLAVLTALWRDVWQLISDCLSGRGHGRSLALALIIATVPGALVGYFCEDIVDQIFVEKGMTIGSFPLEPYKFVGFAFILTAQLFLHNADVALKRRAEKKLLGAGPEALSWSSALRIGIAQAIAVIPGVSRSGATIATAIVSGFSRDFAARFSFLLSIPIIAGSALAQLPKFCVEWPYEPDKHAILAGVLASAVSGFLAIKFMLRLLRSHDLRHFILYLWILGLICIAS